MAGNGQMRALCAESPSPLQGLRQKFVFPGTRQSMASIRRPLRLLRLPVAILVAAGVVWAAPARADEGAFAPHFASLSSAKVSLREGPTYRHRVLWLYRRKGLPVEVTAQYDVWRRVRDMDGTVGWIHSSMLSGQRTVLVTAKKPVRIREDVEQASKTLALAAPGVIAKLDRCQPRECEISVQGVDGWIDKKDVWGVKPGEIF
jgi:SH3-like domain-containing protein